MSSHAMVNSSHVSVSSSHVLGVAPDVQDTGVAEPLVTCKHPLPNPLQSICEYFIRADGDGVTVVRTSEILYGPIESITHVSVSMSPFVGSIRAV